jgi:hypothetical protein
MKKAFQIVCVAAIVGALGSAAMAGNISITGGSMFIRAFDRFTPGSVGESTLAASLPLDLSESVSDHGASNLTTYDFNDSGFTITVDHTRVDYGNSHTQSHQINPILFTIEEDSPYTLSGFYNLAGLDAVLLYGKLTDTTTSQVLFNNQQRSNNTPGQHFILGEDAGDNAASSWLSGDLTGMLTGGHTFELEYHFFIMHRGSNQSADADGQIHLQIVPEPTTLSLLALGAVAILRRRRKR